MKDLKGKAANMYHRTKGIIEGVKLVYNFDMFSRHFFVTIMMILIVVLSAKNYFLNEIIKGQKENFKTYIEYSNKVDSLTKIHIQVLQQDKEILKAINRNIVCDDED